MSSPHQKAKNSESNGSDNVSGQEAWNSGFDLNDQSDLDDLASTIEILDSDELDWTMFNPDPEQQSANLPDLSSSLSSQENADLSNIDGEVDWSFLGIENSDRSDATVAPNVVNNNLDDPFQQIMAGSSNLEGQLEISPEISEDEFFDLIVTDTPDDNGEPYTELKVDFGSVPNPDQHILEIEDSTADIFAENLEDTDVSALLAYAFEDADSAWAEGKELASDFSLDDLGDGLPNLIDDLDESFNMGSLNSKNGEPEETGNFSLDTELEKLQSLIEENNSTREYISDTEIKIAAMNVSNSLESVSQEAESQESERQEFGSQANENQEFEDLEILNQIELESEPLQNIDDLAEFESLDFTDGDESNDEFEFSLLTFESDGQTVAESSHEWMEEQNNQDFDLPNLSSSKLSSWEEEFNLENNAEIISKLNDLEFPEHRFLVHEPDLDESDDYTGFLGNQYPVNLEQSLEPDLHSSLIASLDSYEPDLNEEVSNQLSDFPAIATEPISKLVSDRLPELLSDQLSSVQLEDKLDDIENPLEKLPPLPYEDPEDLDEEILFSVSKPNSGSQEYKFYNDYDFTQPNANIKENRTADADILPAVQAQLELPAIAHPLTENLESENSDPTVEESIYTQPVVNVFAASDEIDNVNVMNIDPEWRSAEIESQIPEIPIQETSVPEYFSSPSLPPLPSLPLPSRPSGSPNPENSPNKPTPVAQNPNKPQDKSIQEKDWLDSFDEIADGMEWDDLLESKAQQDDSPTSFITTKSSNVSSSNINSSSSGGVKKAEAAPQVPAIPARKADSSSNKKLDVFDLDDDSMEWTAILDSDTEFVKEIATIQEQKKVGATRPGNRSTPFSQGNNEMPGQVQDYNSSNSSAPDPSKSNGLSFDWQKLKQPFLFLGAGLAGVGLIFTFLSTGVQRFILENGLKSGIFKDASGKDLNSINLKGGNLQQVNFRRTNLSKANLDSTNLRDADLRGTNLKGVSLRGAKLKGAKLEFKDKKNATKIDERSLLLWQMINEPKPNRNLGGANLDGFYLDGADLRNVNLSRAKLTWVNFDNANLSGANLSGAELTGVSLEGTNLKGATFDGVKWSKEKDKAPKTDARTTCPNGKKGPCVFK